MPLVWLTLVAVGLVIVVIILLKAIGWLVRIGLIAVVLIGAFYAARYFLKKG